MAILLSYITVAIHVCIVTFFSYIHAESHDDVTARLRQFVKDKKFELRNYSKYGLENVLVVPRHKNNQVQSVTIRYVY